MKKRLTDAALDLMWENSYGTDFGGRHLRSGQCKKGSFYYFFKSKSELTAAALEAEWNKNKANMDALFLQQFHRSSGSIATSNMCTTVWPNFNKSAGPILGCPLLSIGSEVSTQDKGRARYR